MTLAVSRNNMQTIVSVTSFGLLHMISKGKKYRLGISKCHDHDILTLHQPIKLYYFERGNGKVLSDLRQKEYCSMNARYKEQKETFRPKKLIISFSGQFFQKLMRQGGFIFYFLLLQIRIRVFIFFLPRCDGHFLL